MTHPLIAQLHFARSEFARCIDGLSDADARRRLEPMNCISWMIGHLAAQEQGYWVMVAQGQRLYPDLHKIVGYGSPPSTPPLAEMLETWHAITAAADVYLATVTPEVLSSHLIWKEKPMAESVGTMLQRNIYHYWFHCGEAYAVRQMLGHTGMGDFVGDMAAAQYRPEQA